MEAAFELTEADLHEVQVAHATARVDCAATHPMPRGDAHVECLVTTLRVATSSSATAAAPRSATKTRPAGPAMTRPGSSPGFSATRSAVVDAEGNSQTSSRSGSAATTV